MGVLRIIFFIADNNPVRCILIDMEQIHRVAQSEYNSTFNSRLKFVIFFLETKFIARKFIRDYINYFIFLPSRRRTFSRLDTFKIKHSQRLSTSDLNDSRGSPTIASSSILPELPAKFVYLAASSLMSILKRCIYNIPSQRLASSQSYWRACGKVTRREIL